VQVGQVVHGRIKSIDINKRTVDLITKSSALEPFDVPTAQERFNWDHNYYDVAAHEEVS
jgi:hypothetical protein